MEPGGREAVVSAARAETGTVSPGQALLGQALLYELPGFGPGAAFLGNQYHNLWLHPVSNGAFLKHLAQIHF
jgi:hypothetical protein